jgi:hypothetical protein
MNNTPEENKPDEPKREKRKHFAFPEDYTNFDEQEFRSFSFTEIFLIVLTLTLIILSIFQIIHFSNLK